MDLITRRVPVKSIGLPKWVKGVLKNHKISEDQMMIRKGISPEDVKFKDSERSSVDYITTKAVDRDGEIVVPNGAILDHYRKNPVVLFGHDYKSLPIGKSLWIKIDEKGLISKTQYAKHQKAEDIYQYRKDGFPMAKSIGFIPLEAVEEADFDKLDLKSLGLKKEDLAGASRVYPKWLMLEYSDVPVPSNPEALQLAISKNILTLDEAKEAAKHAFVIEIIEKDEQIVEKEVSETSTEFIDEQVIAGGDNEEESTKASEEELEKRYGSEIHSESVEEVEEFESHEQIVTAELDEKAESQALEFMIHIEDEEVKSDGFVYHGSSHFKDVKGADGTWNKSLKELDVANIDVQPSTVEYAMLKEWLGCEIREMFVHTYSIPSALMGTYLTGLNESLKGFDLITARNFNSGGSESPLEYDIIQLTSEKSSDFLVAGTEFYEDKETKERISMKRLMTWYGFYIVSSSKNTSKERVVKIFKDMEDWGNENNFLKGECFSLGGEFIKKTDDDWDDLFLSPENITAIKRTTTLINEKGADLANRGQIFMGPPGTGKTLSGRIIRNKTGVTFIWISARDFAYSGSIDGLGYGFRLARSLAPTILFIEDIDNWLSAQTCDLMKTEMDGIAKSKGVVTMLTSNYPELLPPALIDRPGRFHDILNFSLPDANIRFKMLSSWTENVSEKVINEILAETRGFSGAHMYELVAFAKTIFDEGDYTMDEAIIISIKKIKDQRALISNLQNPKDEVAFGDSEVEAKTIEEKAGRVLSKKTRSVMSDAVSAMGKATEAMNELLETADKQDEQEDETPKSEKIIELKEQEEKIIKITEESEEKMINVTKDILASAVADALTSVLSAGKLPSASNIVKQRLDMARGKVT